ncbi:diaminobutyrate-2-oxoglutarate aminotransferase [Vibrio astriarenae]|nr:diaminobutyrate-2-oxoglutarate aminotransferase [Vibrio sp. C7]
MTNGTMGMMGNLGTKARRTGLMSDVHFMPFPYSLRCPFGLGGEEGAKANIRYIERLLNDDEAGIMKPAAIIVEPVQGEGGVIPAPAQWLRELRRICDEHEILLILDEIQCGVGKTGYRFAFEEAGISQIFFVFLKLSVAVCLCRSLCLTRKSIHGALVSTQVPSVVTKWRWYQVQRHLRLSSVITWLSMQTLPANISVWA